MKLAKILLPVLLLGLAACEPSGPTSKGEKPIIELDSNSIEIETGKAYNFYDIARVYDKEDGEISATEIVLESDVGWAFNNGIYTPLESDIGSHDVTYTVSDSDGNLSDPVYLMVEVVKGYGEPELLIEYDLDDNSLGGWKADSGSIPSSLTASRDALVYRVDGAGADSQVTLSKNRAEKLEPGVTYSFASTISADPSVTGSFLILDEEGAILHEEGFTAISEQKALAFSFSVESASDGFSYEIDLSGNQGSYVYEISGMSLNYNVESRSLLFADGPGDYMQEGGTYFAYNHPEYASDPENRYLTYDGDSVSLNVNPGCYNEWNSGIERRSSVPLVKDKRYAVSVDILVAGADFNFEFNFGYQAAQSDPDCQAGRTKLSGSALVGETLHFDRIFTAEANLEAFSIYLKLGTKVGGGASKITLSDFRFEEVSGQKATYTEDFYPRGFNTWNEEGGQGTIYGEDGKLIYQIDKFGSEDRYNKMAIESLMAEEGKLYTLEFTARATSDISCNLFMAERGNWDNGQPISAIVDFSLDDEEYSFTTTAPLSRSADYEILWQFGGLNKPESCTITFCRIAIYVQE